MEPSRNTGSTWQEEEGGEGGMVGAGVPRQDTALSSREAPPSLGICPRVSYQVVVVGVVTTPPTEQPERITMSRLRQKLQSWSLLEVRPPPTIALREELTNNSQHLLLVLPPQISRRSHP